MSKLNSIAILLSALVAGASFASTATDARLASDPIAREAGEGPRGEGGKKGGHCAIQGQDTLAREAGEGPRGEGGKKGGHCAIQGQDQLARNGADDRQPDDRGGRRGGRGGRG